MAATANPSYLKLHGHVWCLKLPVPKALQAAYGGLTHIERSLRTKDRDEANRRKHVLLAYWKADFEKRRRELESGAIKSKDVQEAEVYRRMLADATDDDEVEAVDSVISAEIDRRADLAGFHAASPDAEQHPAFAEVKKFADHVYLGATRTLREAFDDWMPTCDLTPGTKEKYRRALDELVSFLEQPNVLPAAVTIERAQAYVDWLNTKATNAKHEPLDPETKQGRVGALSSFWKKYLEPRKLIPKGSNPWRGPWEYTGARLKRRQGKKRRAFTSEEMLALIRGPERGKGSRYTKRTMLQLYALAFYTGARVEELCDRTLADIKPIRGGYTMHIEEPKSAAGVRDLPIVHPIPVAVIKQRIGKRTDPEAFLFAELIAGGPDDKRSWQVGKAMGDYGRDDVGLPRAVTFHSTRHSFATRMEEAGVDSRWAERYFGHAVPGLMGSRYSHADTLRKVAEAIKYPYNVERAFRAALGIR